MSPTPTEITLTPQEAQYAAMVGIQRHIEALRAARPDRYGANTDDGWTLHIEGAAGELAVAKHLGVYWAAPVNTYSTGGDVGALQVRTRSRHDYDLIVRPKDRDTDRFILVTGRTPHFRLHGWITGAEAKQDRYLQTHGGREPAWFVPAANLHPMEELHP